MKRLVISFLILTAMLGGCATVKGWVSGPSAGKALEVSGETLVSTSLLFETWSRDFAARCAPPSPSLSAATCNRSADFQRYFRPAFHNASALWRVAAKARLAALESGDEKVAAGADALQKDAEKIVKDLRSGLLDRLAEGK